MNKDEALIGFLTGLRTVIHSTQAYSSEHPYFLQSIQEFKQKIDQVFSFLDPVKINVTASSLFLDGKYWDKVFVSFELSQILHSRKIKSVEFKSGLTIAELAHFLSNLSLQPAEILKKDGLSNMLKNVSTQNISIEELDYSRLMGSEGKETKDIWLYLFKTNVEAQDSDKINAFVDSFLAGVDKNLSVKSIIEDANLSKELGSFLSQLKSASNEKFPECLKRITQIVLDSSGTVSRKDINKIKEVFRALDDNDFADILLSQIKSKDNLNTLNFELFSQLAGRERVDKMPSLFSKKKQDLNDNQALAKKVKGILFSPESDNLSPSYRLTLSALIKDISFKSILVFDQTQLQLSYRMVILDFFDQEKSKVGLDSILSRLRKDWISINSDEDYSFFRSLLEVAKKKKSAAEFSADALADIQEWIGGYLETDMWFDLSSKDFIYLFDSMERTYLSADIYFEKIFEENKVSLYGLRQFLMFVPAQLHSFYERLRNRRSDLDFITCVIKVLAELDLPISLAVLKEIYSFGNELTKITVLRQMQNLTEIDADFIFSSLKNKSIALRKEALRVLLKDDFIIKQALDLFFNISSPLGINNRLIIENIRIIEAMHLKAAKDCLARLSIRRFFWNRELKRNALRALESLK
ncbi:MAG: hypothetical protein NTZ63_06170 [Candidatus Omnitrophica bacterium]|nr:hypothetical protein [Candidatus Omnitrophota bacterium]